MSLVYRSAVASLAAQVLVALVTSATYFVPVSYGDDIVAIVSLELASQLIEFVWYALVVFRFRTILTWTRYLDWVVSTPIMLVSTAFFFHHRRRLPIVAVFESYRLYLCLALNWLMLAFGFAVETGAMTRRFVGLALGGAAFVGSFTALSLFLDRDDPVSAWLFVAMYVVWGLYGVAAGFPDAPKNVSYNALDVVSKNFYGVFLFLYVVL